MKDASQIISSIQYKPQYKRILQHKCVQKLKSIMLPSIQKSIKYGYIKEKKLYFIISSTLNKYDRDSIINTIKMVLNGKMIEQSESLVECIEVDIEDVIVRVDHKPSSTFVPYATDAHKLSYHERSSGTLEVSMSDEKLRKIAQEIQEIIKKEVEIVTLLETIRQLPSSPGIYQYFDKNGRLLYIGKAKNLSNRVKSYWSFMPKLAANPRLSIRVSKMIEQSASLNYIVVNSEHDALILENSLIKQLRPKYNILLRDDKTYPYIYIDKTEKYPRFEITRKIIKSERVEYFGPYSVGARDILDSLYSLCRLVQKKSCIRSKKLCLYYQIDRCLGPCELDVTQQRYQEEIEMATSLIKNKKTLIKRLQEKMEFYADALRFEEAGEIRDAIEKIGRSEIKSGIDFASEEKYDIFVVERSLKRAVIVRIFMRHGKIVSSSHDFIYSDDEFDINEAYSRAIIDYYKNEAPPIVAPILVADEFEDRELIESHLSHLFDKKAQISLPLRGKRKKLIEFAKLNAQEHLKNDTTEPYLQLLQEIALLCSLEKTPRRVEVFDNSHMGGEATVGAMIVWQEGSFDKKSYRIYHLDAKDEYAQMREMLMRRVESFTKNSPPDLWILDGGATLLKLALDILSSSGVFLDVIAISKEKVDAKAHRAKGKANDTIYTKNELFRLQNSDKRLQWIQNLRDEAHRSAIGFHKKTKLKRDQESKLLELHGISHAKIKKLLSHFGTFEEIKRVSLDDLSLVLNKADAKTVKSLYK